ncbi:hypothetical protein SAMN05428981_108134 [Bacillus sp. OV194]|nr:hypothetical protein SAMN05428981_108134 [Bacillus sp. OV194]
MVHFYSAQDVVKKTETKFREADQQLFSADGFTSFLSGTLFATVKQGASSLSKGIKYGKVTAKHRNLYVHILNGFITSKDMIDR